MRAHAEGKAARAAATALLAWFLVKLVVTLMAQLGGVFNALGWFILAIDGVTLAGCASILIRRHSSAGA